MIRSRGQIRQQIVVGRFPSSGLSNIVSASTEHNICIYLERRDIQRAPDAKESHSWNMHHSTVLPPRLPLHEPCAEKYFGVKFLAKLKERTLKSVRTLDRSRAVGARLNKLLNSLEARIASGSLPVCARASKSAYWRRHCDKCRRAL